MTLVFAKDDWKKIFKVSLAILVILIAGYFFNKYVHPLPFQEPYLLRRAWNG